MNEIKVTIEGYDGSGKSALATLIAKALRDHGIEVANMDLSGEGAARTVPEALACIRILGRAGHPPHVTIIHKTVKRSRRQS